MINLLSHALSRSLPSQVLAGLADEMQQELISEAAELDGLAGSLGRSSILTSSYDRAKDDGNLQKFARSVGKGGSSPYEKLPLPQQGGAVCGGLAALFHAPVLNSLQSAAAEVELEAQHSSNVGATVELDAAELEATRTTINLVNMLNEGASLNMSEVVAAVEAIADNADNAGVESSVAVEAFVETEAAVDNHPAMILENGQITYVDMIVHNVFDDI